MVKSEFRTRAGLRCTGTKVVGAGEKYNFQGKCFQDLVVTFW